MFLPFFFFFFSITPETTNIDDFSSFFDKFLELLYFIFGSNLCGFEESEVWTIFFYSVFNNCQHWAMHNGPGHGVCIHIYSVTYFLWIWAIESQIFIDNTPLTPVKVSETLGWLKCKRNVANYLANVAKDLNSIKYSLKC